MQQSTQAKQTRTALGAWRLDLLLFLRLRNFGLICQYDVTLTWRIRIKQLLALQDRSAQRANQCRIWNRTLLDEITITE